MEPPPLRSVAPVSQDEVRPSGGVPPIAVKTWRLFKVTAILPGAFYIISSLAFGIALNRLPALNTLPDLAAVVAGLIGLAVLLMLFALFLRRERLPWSWLGFRRFQAKYLLAIPLLFVLEVVVVRGLEALLARPRILTNEPQDVFLAVSQGPPESITLSLLSAVLLAPLIEELVFRGYLFTQYRRSIAPTSAAVVAGLLFGAIHLGSGLTSALGAFLGGLIYAGLRHKSDSLVPAVIAHSLWNLSTFFKLPPFLP